MFWAFGAVFITTSLFLVGRFLPKQAFFRWLVKKLFRVNHKAWIELRIDGLQSALQELKQHAEGVKSQFLCIRHEIERWQARKRGARNQLAVAVATTEIVRLEGNRSSLIAMYNKSVAKLQEMIEIVQFAIRQYQFAKTTNEIVELVDGLSSRTVAQSFNLQSIHQREIELADQTEVIRQALLGLDWSMPEQVHQQRDSSEREQAAKNEVEMGRAARKLANEATPMLTNEGGIVWLPDPPPPVNYEELEKRLLRLMKTSSKN